MTPYKAVIFDLDGTLLETERLVIEAGLAAMAACGLTPDRALLEGLVGTVADESAAAFRNRYGADVDMAAFETAWDAEFTARLAQGIPLRPGVETLLTWLDRNALPFAVATNSRTLPARDNIARAGIGRFFRRDHIIGRDQVAAPKPAPDVFLRAAAILGVAPADCLAFEDSDPGAEAAHAAGMTVVMVPDQRKPGVETFHHLADSLIAGARLAGLAVTEDA